MCLPKTFLAVQPDTVPAVQPDTAPAVQPEIVPEVQPDSDLALQIAAITAMESQTIGHTVANPYQVLLENEQKAIKNLETSLLGKHQNASHFITHLHSILGLDKPHSDKLLLLQYAHILEDKVNDVHPEHFAIVEKEVLNEAKTTMKENTLFGKN